MISIEVKADKTLRSLSALTLRLRDRTVPNRQIGAQLFSWVMRNFDQSGALQAKPWDPLSPSRAKWKVAHGYSSKPLLMTGNLRQSFAPFSDNNTVGIGARASFGVDYAEVHEHGSEVRNIPARPMLPPANVVHDYAVRIYELFVKVSHDKAGL